MNQTPLEKDDEKGEHVQCQMDPEQMWQALTDIAEEVQNYLSSQSNLHDANLNGSFECECEDKLKAYKLKLKSKQKIIKSLQENLNTACMIAKTALTAKEKDLTAYNNKLSQVKKDSASLLNQNAEHCEKLKKLTAENKILSDAQKNMDSFINVGYIEVLKMLHEESEDIPVLMKLKKIMITCGQYYADFCNERDRNVQLEQKNRYLQNKLNILENSITGLMEEHKKCKCNNGPKDNKKINKCCRTVEYVSSDYQMNSSTCASTTTTNVHNWEPVKDTESSRKLTPCTPACSLDLSAHFSLVQSLLSDQDSMLQDLKSLANELNTLNVQS